MKRMAWMISSTLFLFPASAWAHLVNQDVGEFYAGMLHPLTSFEHLLPAAVLGLLAGRQGLRGARWALFVFPAALILGTWFGSDILASPGLSQADLERTGATKIENVQETVDQLLESHASVVAVPDGPYLVGICNK